MAQSENIDSQNLTSNLADALKIKEKLNSKGEDANKLSGFAVSLEDEFLKQIKEETKITEQIEALDDQILLLRQKMLETDDKSLKILIDQYSKYKAILSQIDKKTEALKEARKELAAVLGGSAELAETFKEAGYAALALKAAVSGFEKMGEQFSNIFGTSFDMMKTLGVSVKEAGAISGELGMANVSMTGLLYGSEATAEAAKELADQYGIAGMATTDMIKGVTQLSALTGDAASAVDLALAYENAGIAASDVKANIQEIAGSVGVNANKVAKDMAENQDLIVNATKEELALNTRLTAELVKQGATREGIRQSAKSLMDVENSVQQANKIALLTGKQINVSRLTEAAMMARTAEGADNKLRAQNDLLTALKDELGVNGDISEQSDVTIEAMESLTGLSKEQLLNIEKAKLAQMSFNEQVTAAGGIWGYLKGLIAGSGLGLIDMGKEFAKMVAQAVIFKTIMEADSLNPLKFFKGVVKGSKEAFTTAGSFFKKMLGFGAAPITEATTTLAENVGGSATDNLKDTAIDKAKETVTDKANETVETVIDKAKETVSPTNVSDTVVENTQKIDDVGKKSSSFGKKLGDNLKGLASGLKAMGNSKVLFGAFNLMPAALGFVTILAGIPGMKGVSAFGVSAGAGLVGLAPGLKAMGNTKVLFGAINLIPAALGFVTILAGIPGMKAVSAFGVSTGAGLVGLASGLKAMGGAKVYAGTGNLMLAAIGFTLMTLGSIGLAAVALGGVAAGAGLQGLAVGLSALGASSVAGLIGIGLLALLGLALIPLTYGLSLLAPLIESIGNTIATVLPAIGDAISTIINSIGELITKIALIASPELAGGIALFGLSLIPLSAGLGALAIGLALLTPFLPTLLALAAIGTGLALVANFIGGDSNNDREQSAEIKNKKDPLLEEIRGLRADIKNQPINVVLNNKIVGEINRGSRAINSYVNK